MAIWLYFLGVLDLVSRSFPGDRPSGHTYIDVRASVCVCHGQLAVVANLLWQQLARVKSVRSDYIRKTVL